MSTDHSRRKDGIFPLIDACHQGIKEQVVHLLQHGANPNVPAEDGCTAVHSASAENRVDILELFLAPPHSCNVNTCNDFNETPLHVACLNGCQESARLLAQHGADVEARDGKGNTVLHLSAASGSQELIHCVIDEMKGSALVDSQNKDLDTPAHCAARLGCREAFSALCKLGANLDLRNRWDRTPLEEFAQYNNSSPLASKSPSLDEKEEENRRNNHAREMSPVERNARSQSEPRRPGRRVGEKSGSRSATNITRDDTQVASAATHNPTHDKSSAATGEQSNCASASKSATNIETGGTSATGSSTPVWGMGKKKAYHVSKTWVDELKGGARQRAYSEKLPQRKKKGTDCLEVTASGPLMRHRSQSDKRDSRKPNEESLV